MNSWARLEDNAVAELIDFDPAGRFHPSLRWAAVPAGLADWVEPGWRRARNGFAPPSPTAFDAALAARVAARRWRAEIVRIAVGGMAVMTDAKTETRIGRMARAVAAGRAESVPWKLADGRFVDLTPAQIAAIDRAIGAHLEACFARERAILEAVQAAGTVAAKIAAYTAAIDAGWPEAAGPEPGAPPAPDDNEEGD